MKKFHDFKSYFIKIISILMIIVLTSCATIINGNYGAVSVKSTPSEAKIFVNGVNFGFTPAKIRLERGERHVIEIKLDGYQTYKITTSKSVSGWILGNLLCGGLIGLAIDFISGSAYDVKPKTIVAELEKGIGCIENHSFDNFTSIKVVDKNGKDFGNFTIDWK